MLQQLLNRQKINSKVNMKLRKAIYRKNNILLL
jgi:hypothetical protein